jgi:hypothetical protein
MLRQRQRLKFSYNNNPTANTLHINRFPCETATCFLLLWRCAPTRVMASSFTRFLHHTQRHTAVGRTPLLPTHRTPLDTQHSQQTNIHACGEIRTRNLSKRVATWISRYSDIRRYLYKHSTELLYILPSLKL